MSTAPETNPASAARADDELSLLDFAIVLAKFKWLVLGVPLLAAVVAYAVASFLTPIYTASAKLLPPQQSQSIGGGVSQGGTLAALGGLLGVGRSPSDIFVPMLQSRTIADAMIARFKLLEHYGTSSRGLARHKLAKASSIVAGKDGLIRIDVADPDPKMAVALANGYSEELEKLSNVMAFSEASRRRLFLERQLAQAKDGLLKAELAARSALDHGGLAAVDVQGRTIIQTTASLRAQIATKEVELMAMRGFATEENPQYRRSQRELAAMKEQLAKLERGGTGAVERLGKDEGFKNVTILRELRYQEGLFEVLARQYEIAKVDEAKEGAVIQMLDRAIEPEGPSGPRRDLIVITTALAAALVAVVLAFLLEALERARRDPLSRGRVAELAAYLRRWRPGR